MRCHHAISHTEEIIIAQRSTGGEVAEAVASRARGGRTEGKRRQGETRSKQKTEKKGGGDNGGREKENAKT